VGTDLERLLFHLARRDEDRRALDTEGPAAKAALAVRNAVTIGVDHLDPVDIDTELFGDDLENVVTWPWPCGWLPVITVTSPV
jgi:hypothetical protein